MFRFSFKTTIGIIRDSTEITININSSPFPWKKQEPNLNKECMPALCRAARGGGGGVRKVNSQANTQPTK